MAVSLHKGTAIREITPQHLMDENEAMDLYGVKRISAISRSKVSLEKKDIRDSVVKTDADAVVRNGIVGNTGESAVRSDIDCICGIIRGVERASFAKSNSGNDGMRNIENYHCSIYCRIGSLYIDSLRRNRCCYQLV